MLFLIQMGFSFSADGIDGIDGIGKSARKGGTVSSKGRSRKLEGQEP